MQKAPTQNQAEVYTPTPYAERASQNIGFGDFLKRAVFKIVFGSLSGIAVGHIVGRIMKARHNAYAQVGGAIGAMVGGYFTWRREEASKLEVDQVLIQYKDLPGLICMNEEMMQDNAILQKIAEHQREASGAHPATYTTQREHKGLVKPSHEMMAQAERQ